MVVLTSSRTQFFGGTKVNITFVNRAQKEFQVKAREGDTVLDTVLDNMIEYDGFGVCGGGIACSTCHVVLEKEVYETTDPESDEEWDMLDNASGLTHPIFESDFDCLTE
jgi:ferredoxin